MQTRRITIENGKVTSQNVSENERAVLENAASDASPRINELWMQGELFAGDLTAIAVVGSRHMSEYGREVCEYFVRELAAAGVTIVSGLMYGVDACAHRAALSADGRTIAVLGYGMNHLKDFTYTEEIASDIVSSHNGAIITEYEPNQSPQQFTFPKRNRVVVAFSQAVLIIEAGEKSGSLITAGYAIDQGKEVFVIPGSIFSPESYGKHFLIKSGAFLVDKPSDILEMMGVSSKHEQLETASLSDEEQVVLSALKGYKGAVSTDELIDITGFSFPQISRYLTNLQLQNRISQDKAGNWRSGTCRK